MGVNPEGPQEPANTSYDRKTVCGYCGESLSTGNHNHILERIVDKIAGRGSLPNKEMKRCMRCGVQTDSSAVSCPKCQKQF